MSRTLVMGIVNVTPDSFSDGGRWLDPAAATAHGLQLAAEGADLLDVGGESTRPGAVRPSAQEEVARVEPVVRGLRQQGVTVSLDTMRADVARAGVRAGAAIVNDVSGGLADAAMLDTVAELGVDYVCMHWRGLLGGGDTNADYDDVVDDVLAELSARRDACLAAGIERRRIILDPGIGFSKDADQNWQLLAALSRFQNVAVAGGHRLLVGASRKRFLGTLLDGRPAEQRDDATAAITAESARLGVWAVRTHTARVHADVVRVAERLQAARTAVAGHARPVGPDRTPGEPLPGGVPDTSLPYLDWIVLSGLTATGRHGVLPEERRDGQTFVVDVELGLAPERRDDRLDRTVNYAEVAEQVHAVITGDPVDLIETLAEQVADAVLRHQRLVRAVRVRVHKPQAPITVAFADVQVAIERQRGQGDGVA